VVSPHEAFTGFLELAGEVAMNDTIDTTTVPAPADPAGHKLMRRNQQFLRDIFGSPLRDGACVLDADREIGYIRLEYGSRRGPDSAYWDGWFSVTRTREAHPLSGKVMNGQLVQLIGSPR
jgi:hypothetical protein